MTNQITMELAPQTAAGFRLHRMEVYNWGTFHDSVWKIDPAGSNSLLTGDIGSGKSTVVDALTTLLVPTQRITYNKAAGAQSKERSLSSYVRGAYKSEKSELTQSSKAITLRDESHYTVLLAWFYNADFKQGMTIAQVFWSKEGNTNPERFYLTAEKPLKIKTHFSRFGNDINGLKKKLRKIPSVKISSTFREYSTHFRRFFGIQSEQALDLFYQTVSMKSVGNLTEFVRHHMLEKTNVDTQLDELLRGFDNLNRLHEAVLKARQQIEELTPLCDGVNQFAKLQQSIQALRDARTALSSWFARFEHGLLLTHIGKLEKQSKRMEHQLEKLLQTIQSLRDKENDLRRNIEDQGGRRLREIERETQQLSLDVKRCKREYEAYQKACSHLDLDAVLDENRFYKNHHQSEIIANQLQKQQQKYQLDYDKNVIEQNQARTQHADLSQEIESLRQRKSNIAFKSLALRQAMADTLKLDEDELPFIGELLQVDEKEAEWEGAVERVLHNFGLSLLVPERHYARVSQYVEQTHLKGRLVYFRVEGKVFARQQLEPNSLADKLRIKPESEFYDWLEHSLAKRFDYHCSETLEDFRRYPYAITKKGQVKAGGQRHEKDDRYSIHDRSRYILGWSNREKLKVLENQQKQLEAQIQKISERIIVIDTLQRQLQQKHVALRDLQRINQFADVDWQSPSLIIEQLQQEKQEIENSSDVLQQLQKQLDQTIDERKQQEQQERELLGERGTLKNKIQNDQIRLQNSKALADDFSDEMIQNHQALLENWREKALGNLRFNLRNLEKAQREMRESMSNCVGNDMAKLNTLTQRIIQKMQDYKRNYPTETSEVDARIEAGQEYQQMLDVLQSEDLPRHEATFKKMLNEQTIQGVVMFQSQLENERRAIEEKITLINQSLQQIEYSRGSYIELVANIAADVDVRDFRSDLKQCLQNTLDSDDLYTETRFLQVKNIMERFRGREGQVEQDRKWMKKVTDVRNWYNFSASERWRENGEEKEFYSDSAGKSGGQKEKLAYTILASALAYQFGLESGDSTNRSFRFVAIDEAFGKGSDESTRYALELFRKLNLQLLIVTPLQKIHVIEDYINAVHFVHNREGKYSMLRNLSIEEYRAEKEKVKTLEMA